MVAAVDAPAEERRAPARDTGPERPWRPLALGMIESRSRLQIESRAHVPYLLLNGTWVETGERSIASELAIDWRQFPGARDQVAQLGLHDVPLARREVVALEAAEEVGLAVVGEAGAVGGDELGGVVHRGVGALGVSVRDGDPVPRGDLRDRVRGLPVGRLGEAGDVVADGVPGEEHLRRGQQPGARGGGTARGLVEDLEVPVDRAGAAGALEQGGAHA
jgi:hypothetical protein